VWGKAPQENPRRFPHRIIPTRVGKSNVKRAVDSGTADHPHACGEKCEIVGCCCRFIGSSPRVWGKVPRKPRVIIIHRIIPTRVGKRNYDAPVGDVDSDHPHACGEKDRTTRPRGRKTGSSPRVWGKACSPPPRRTGMRIIPTRVGKSACSRGPSRAPPDHPHACGEKPRSKNFLIIVSGSSPRVWGKGRPLPEPVKAPRIIPTRVGKRAVYLPPRMISSDHPHACGEKTAPSAFSLPRTGSSPRVWGKGATRSRWICGVRIIPTRVGKRGEATFTVGDKSDHPHACGEKRHPAGRKPSDLGSSPRVWGKARGV